MKLHISAVLAATLIAGLTACGGGEAQTAAENTSQSAAPSATPKPTKTKTTKPIPNVVSKPFIEARGTLNAEGYYARIVDKGGKKWTNIVPDETVVVVSTSPAAGGVSDDNFVDIVVNFTEAEYIAASQAKADAAKLAARYTYTCGSYSSTQPVYKSYKEVWGSPAYKSGGTCSVKMGGVSSYDKAPLIPSEQKLVDFVASKGGDVSAPSATVGKVMSLCAKLEAGYADEIVVRSDWRKAEAEGALSICPDAPHAAVLQETLTAIKVGDGNKVVGQTMEPGTYKTKPGIKDCYWSRNTGGGDIIDNDFVSFAPDGATVTVYAGEGFESERCGVWTKIG